MPTDPYAVLRALLRAEARRAAPTEKRTENEQQPQAQAEQSR
ncbi:hypothetical protein [Streptomyces acidiscabies]|uniref:Uncharacterized protein n=1 Tax=Streptomyces acidiscabies TaxID=42234 RepID=A0AAP6EHB0_9ACTN|nr:hypothetical protein [Streptomyces acidiscabies]MDX2962195.1 hypothetical protein [Streptomyces acidiscabies]MDX3019647.1 hypothetical protein [Streptomyces acidiscabies]GAQ58858.1 hypothetical protein a10_08756 [Streptomyces acidiscabies]GAV45825.1 hypothetical protein Saa2_08818 [Streptomyces acidiscabies]